MKPNLLEAFCEICGEAGAFSEVGPEFYEQCADLSDAEMEELIVAIAFANAESINRMVFDEPRTKSDAEIIELIRKNLVLMFRGYISIQENGRLGGYAPVGPEPTEDEEDALDWRIRSALPLVPKAIIFGMQCDNRDKRLVSLSLLNLRKPMTPAEAKAELRRMRLLAASSLTQQPWVTMEEAIRIQKRLEEADRRYQELKEQGRELEGLEPEEL